MTIAPALTYREGEASGIGFLPMVVAIITAFVAGYASIGLFMKALEENRLHYFAGIVLLPGAFAVLTYLMGS